MVTPVYKPNSASKALGTSARILRQSQAFKRPYDKTIGYKAGAIFIVVFVLMSLVHGFSIGHQDALSGEVYRAAVNLWDHAFIGEGATGNRLDVLFNPSQFTYFFLVGLAHIPFWIAGYIQSLALVGALGYSYSRMVTDKATNWILASAAIVATLLFANGNIALSFASGNHHAWTGTLVAITLVEMALDIRRGLVRNDRVWLVTLAVLSHPLAILFFGYILYYYYQQLANAQNKKTLNLILIYSIASAILLLLIRLLYFGTLGFFDPIINFQWQIQVHGLSSIWGSITSAFYQFEGANGLLGFILIVMALFVDRIPSLGFLGISCILFIAIQGLAAMMMPLFPDQVSHFTWLAPVLTFSLAYFSLNPLPQFLVGWNTRLFLTVIGAAMLVLVSWNGAAKQYAYKSEAAKTAVNNAIASVGMPLVQFFGLLPDPEQVRGLNWLSEGRLFKTIQTSPGLYNEVFFEILIPDVAVFESGNLRYLQLRQDGRFDKSFALVEEVDGLSIYIRKEIRDKGDEFQLIKKLSEVLDNSSDPGKDAVRICQQASYKSDLDGGVYSTMPLVRCLNRLATKLEWLDALEDVGNAVENSPAGFLGKSIVTASYTARLLDEQVAEMSRYYFINNFALGSTDHQELLKMGNDPVSALPSSPGFADGAVKVFLNKNSLIIYLPNAGNVDQMANFYIKYFQQKGSQTEENQHFSIPSFRISDLLVLLGPQDGYASFTIPSLQKISSIELGQRKPDGTIIWQNSFSLQRLRTRENF